ncbi:collectin-12-like [Manacus candei]|uniref:collectin-12-like n=1 Tax=Manacus candei TaxID=415023 RepID=UPI0022267993|nr:collectin-12-like [Manacus candei]
MPRFLLPKAWADGGGGCEEEEDALGPPGRPRGEAGERGGQIPPAEPGGRGRFEGLPGAGRQRGGKGPEMPPQEGLQSQPRGL